MALPIPFIKFLEEKAVSCCEQDGVIRFAADLLDQPQEERSEKRAEECVGVRRGICNADRPIGLPDEWGIAEAGDGAAEDAARRQAACGAEDLVPLRIQKHRLCCRNEERVDAVRDCRGAVSHRVVADVEIALARLLGLHDVEQRPRLFRAMFSRKVDGIVCRDAPRIE